MATIETEYIATGGNRHPNAADWDPKSGLLAFGADRNIAIWDPQNVNHNGVRSILTGHTDKVNAVVFFPGQPAGAEIIISGSVDKSLRIWVRDTTSPMGFTCVTTLEAHESSINAIATAPGSDIFASGSADATVKIWQLNTSAAQNVSATLLQTVAMAPRYFPLCLALSSMPATPGSLLLAVAGTKNIVQVFVADSSQGTIDFNLQATLTGHEGWIRSLAFTTESKKQKADLVLASASQDKYIRLWRVHEGEELPQAAAAPSDALGDFGKSLSNKAHRFSAGGLKYSITFEALLLGHEDWIYTARWHPDVEKHQLLSSSADNSLSIWEPDEESGVWQSVARLGEISAQKGSTSATGSTGGFWIGLWSPNGDSTVSLGRTGGWRLWDYDTRDGRWVQGTGISGHTKEVTGISWGKDGKYLLSTSSDQTTRLYAEWKRGTKRSWHEFARPQIHGYDLNCVDALGTSQFVSGADEKLLRVFDEPKGIATLLEKLCGITESTKEEMPDAANMPVLGLSNKAIQAIDESQAAERTEGDGQEVPEPGSVANASTLDLDYPPFEDHLARHTLWPEHEKLYGHGYEISALACSHDGTLIATACKASSIEHAVIRLFSTSEWREITPPLSAHTLTVTSLTFSEDDHFLLSVGRDRQWAVWQRGVDDRSSYQMAANNEKGHSRMILDGAWAPVNWGKVFATAGRDKNVKLWAGDGPGFGLKVTISMKAPATAIDFLNEVAGGVLYLAVGTETGGLTLCGIKGDEVAWTREFDTSINPSRSITQVAWRPHKAAAVVNGNEADHDGNDTGKYELAVASDDSSLRFFSISNLGS